MIVTLGDLVEDVVVELGGPVNIASDTAARITRRRGGSAANVAAAVAALGHASRFIGQVGDDPTGVALAADLARTGVDVGHVRHSGTTATIIVLVDTSGERTMLVDPGSARLLDGAEAVWLDDADVLHLTLYSLLDEPIASVSRSLVAMAHERSIDVSIDVSSVALIETVGTSAVLDLVRSLRPAVVFANGEEAQVLGVSGPIADASVIVKQGPDPCVIHRVGRAPVEVAASALEAAVDTTGAGDAFAAGLLADPGWRSDLEAACRSGHRSAHALLAGRVAARR